MNHKPLLCACMSVYMCVNDDDTAFVYSYFALY